MYIPDSRFTSPTDTAAVFSAFLTPAAAGPGRLHMRITQQPDLAQQDTPLEFPILWPAPPALPCGASRRVCLYSSTARFLNHFFCRYLTYPMTALYTSSSITIPYTM